MNKVWPHSLRGYEGQRVGHWNQLPIYEDYSFVFSPFLLICMHYSSLSNYRHKLILTLQWTYSSDFDWHPCVLLQTVYIRVRRLLFIKNTLTHIYILSLYCTPSPGAPHIHNYTAIANSSSRTETRCVTIKNAKSSESYIFSQLFFYIFGSERCYSAPIHVYAMCVRASAL